MLSQANLDMASARNFIDTFSGSVTEEVSTWLCGAHITKFFLNIDDNIMLRVTALQLRSPAQQWFCQLILQRPNITYNEFCSSVTSRFSNSGHTHGLVTRFFEFFELDTKKKFEAQLDIATRLIYLKAITTQTAIDWLIKCECENLKEFLVSVRAQEQDDWQRFLEIFYNELWIVTFATTKKSTPLKMINNFSQMKSTIIQSKMGDIELTYCVFLGQCMQTAEKCNKLKKYITKL
ncbi:hypothetical protein COBT_002333 [Conglomerata obtusa]